MALFHRKKKQEEEQTPELPDDAFAFDDDAESITADLPTDEPEEEEEETASETPEEALARFRATHPYADRRATGEDLEGEDTPRPRPLAELDAQSEEEKAERKRKRKHKRRGDADDAGSVFYQVRRAIRAAITAAFFLLVIMIAASYFISDIPFLQLPEELVAKVVTPVQSYFSGATGAVADYLRKLKLRATLEEAYEAVVAENEQLA